MASCTLRRCRTCAGEYTSTSPVSKYCSPECRRPPSFGPHLRRYVWRCCSCERVIETSDEPLCDWSYLDVRAERFYAYWDREEPLCHTPYSDEPIYPSPYNCRRCDARWRLARAALGGGTDPRHIWCQGSCRRCGSQFAVLAASGHLPAYCSDRCSGARRKGAGMTPVRRRRVFERDGWVCRICGDPVNREAQHPAPDAAVVDHRIPLAAGGDHCPDNWQTAHSYCNSAKGARVDFEFAERG